MTSEHDPVEIPLKALPRLARIIEESFGLTVGECEMNHLTRNAIAMAVNHMVKTGMLYRDEGEWRFRDPVKESNGA